MSAASLGALEEVRGFWRETVVCFEGFFFELKKLYKVCVLRTGEKDAMQITG